MSEVVNGPGREELRKRDGSEGGVLTAQLEVLGFEIQRTQFPEIV